MIYSFVIVERTTKNSDLLNSPGVGSPIVRAANKGCPTFEVFARVESKISRRMVACEQRLIYDYSGGHLFGRGAGGHALGND
jgi:hypothetical protein